MFIVRCADADGDNDDDDVGIDNGDDGGDSDVDADGDVLGDCGDCGMPRDVAAGGVRWGGQSCGAVSKGT